MSCPGWRWRRRFGCDGTRPFDAHLCYHFDALAAVHPLRLSLLAAVGDLWHLPAYFRWKDSPFSLAKYTTRGLKTALESLMGQRAMSTLLTPTQSCGAFAGHYAEWLKTHGAPNVHYFRTPVPDVTGAQWEPLRETARTRRDSKNPRLLVIGDLATT
ncbi:MAG: hypothetical protein MRJ92_12655 [Nitrospira sp.]|nr:hypothetical protein [Nitrospira sp.]